MAQIKSKPNLTDPNAQLFDRRKWTTKEEMNDVAKVYSQVDTYMRPYRDSACWFDSHTKSMTQHWDNCLKQYVMTSTSQTTEEGFANVQPPTTWKNVEAIMAEFVDDHMRLKVRPEGGGLDTQRSYIIEQIFEHNANLHDFDRTDAYIFWTMILKGVAYAYVPWTTIVDSGQFTKDSSSLTKEEQALLTNMKQLTYEAKNYKVYDDYDVVHVPNEQMFVSPEGTRFYGRHRVIGKKVWENWIGYDEFLHMFLNDPFAKNVNRVVPTGSDQIVYSQYFQQTHIAGRGNMVRLWLYEDIFNDEIILIANDIRIKKMPLPDRFKGKSMFVDFHFVDLPDYHYTPGLAAILAGQQEELATIKNMIYDQLHININPPTYVDSLLAEEYMSERQRSVPGAIIPITGLADKPNAIKEHETNPTGLAQALNMIPMIEGDITETSGLNPRKFGVIQRSGNATEVQSNDAASYKLLMKAIRNFANAKAQVGTLQYLWIQSKYADPITDADGKIIYNNKKPSLRTITLDGIQISPSDDEGILFKKTDKIGYHPLELKAELVILEGDVSIFIDPEFEERLTRDMQVQTMQNTLAQISAYAGIPGMPAKYGGPAIIDINKALKDYLKVQNISLDWLIQKDTDRDEDLKEASEHMQQIIEEGIPVIGKPGVSKDHMEYEQGCYRNLEAAVLLLKDKMAKEQQNLQIAIDPMTGQAIPPQPSKVEEKLFEFMDKLRLLEIHLLSHGAPLGSPQPSLGQLDQAQQQMNAPQPPMGPGGPQSPNSNPNPGQGQASQPADVPPPTPMAQGPQ